CVLNVRGMPRTLARGFAAIPPGAGRRLSAMPGKVGTTLAMSDSIAHNLSMQRRLIDATDRMVVLNDAARRMLEANDVPPSMIVVNRLGLNHTRRQRERATQTGSPVRFGFLGRFHETKGVRELARAILRIDRRVPFRFEFRGPFFAAADRAIRT